MHGAPAECARQAARRRWLLQAIQGVQSVQGLQAAQAAQAAARALGLTAASLAAPTQAALQDQADSRVQRGRRLRFPRDHGAHLHAGIEWWYATGWLASAQAPETPSHGFQLTFFRRRLAAADADAGAAADATVANTLANADGVANDVANPVANDVEKGSAGKAAGRSAAQAAAAHTASAASRGRFAPQQLLMAHAALTDLAAARHRHAQRLQRWNGDGARPALHAAQADTDLALGAWWLRRQARADGGSRYLAHLPAAEAGFALRLQLDSTQPLLLQGEDGWSRKGPLPQQASHYLTQPQLAVQAQLQQGSRRQTLVGRAWLDHEWSDSLLAPDAVGWDWIGINLHDGAALTAFVLRRADGSALWGGGSWRAADGRTLRPLAAHQVAMTPQRWWTSPATGTRWPVDLALQIGAQRLWLHALLDAQEMDSRRSTGTLYWEGLAELRDAPGGRRLGLGYLEMTGRGSRLQLG